MAHYKRGKCRRHCHARGSTTSWRAKHGFKPARVPDFDVEYSHLHIWRNRGEWLAAWAEHRREYWYIQPRPWLSQMGSEPAWHDREFHIRPHRARTKRAERAILKGADPEAMNWPIPYRPRIYYW